LVEVNFITAEGEKVRVEAASGVNLLALAQSSGMALEGTCEGQMACSTCHIIVAEEWFEKLKVAAPEEEDMLDLAASVQRTSRLSCQIDLTDDLNGIEVSVPSESRDMQIV